MCEIYNCLTVFIIRQVNLPQKVPKQENFHGSLQKPQAESEE